MPKVNVMLSTLKGVRSLRITLPKSEESAQAPAPEAKEPAPEKGTDKVEAALAQIGPPEPEEVKELGVAPAEAPAPNKAVAPKPGPEEESSIQSIVRALYQQFEDADETDEKEHREAPFILDLKGEEAREYATNVAATAREQLGSFGNNEVVLGLKAYWQRALYDPRQDTNNKDPEALPWQKSLQGAYKFFQRRAENKRRWDEAYTKLSTWLRENGTYIAGGITPIVYDMVVNNFTIGNEVPEKDVAHLIRSGHYGQFKQGEPIKEPPREKEEITPSESPEQPETHEETGGEKAREKIAEPSAQEKQEEADGAPRVSRGQYENAKEKIQVLDGKFGAGKGAAKERKNLQRVIRQYETDQPAAVAPDSKERLRNNRGRFLPRKEQQTESSSDSGTTATKSAATAAQKKPRRRKRGK